MQLAKWDFLGNFTLRYCLLSVAIYNNNVTGQRVESSNIYCVIFWLKQDSCGNISRMKNVAAAVSFVAIPIGFASLASLWANRSEDTPPKEERKKDVDEAVASIGSAHRIHADAFFAYLEELQRRNADHTDMQEPSIIVIEGLPGSGVTTLVNNLVEYTVAVSGAELPVALTQFTSVLSKVPPALGYAYQCVCNYAKSLDHEDSPFVIVERMYHSTCALTVCGETSPSQDLTTLPPSAFHWPVDLTQPAMVLYLAVPPRERIGRIAALSGSGEAAEATQKKHFEADARMQLAYSLVTGPAIEALDATGSPEEVLDIAVQCLDHHGIFLRDHSCPPLPRAPNEQERTSLAAACEIQAAGSAQDELYIADEDAISDSRASCRRSSIYGGRGNKRQSMGVYGAMLKMDW